MKAGSVTDGRYLWTPRPFDERTDGEAVGRVALTLLLAPVPPYRKEVTIENPRYARLADI